MDHRRIDAIARLVAASRSRRSAIGLAAAIATGAIPAAEGIDAKGKKKRCKTVKCFGKCIPAGAECCYSTGGYCDPGLTCCGSNSCMPDLATCCPNGTWCGYRETCCPPSPSFPTGSCITASAPVGSICCQDFHCYPGSSCCPPPPFDPSGGYCVWNDEGFCCPASAGGGYCFFGDKCCPPIPGYPGGFCVPLSSFCPTSAESPEARGLIKPKPRSGSRGEVSAANSGARRSPNVPD